jgi:DNA polymerase-3 subunit delta
MPPKQNIHPVYLLKGTDPFRREQALAEIVGALVDPDFRDFDLSLLDGREATAEDILAAAAAVPFASKRRVTVIDDAQCLGPDVVDRLKALLPVRTGDRATLIFVITEAKGRKGRGSKSGDSSNGADDGEGGSAPVARRLAVLAQSLGTVVTCDRLKPDEARRWLAETVGASGKRIQPAAAAAVVDRAGLDLSVLSQEADKLVLFVGDRDTITRDDVLAVVPETAEFTIWTLTDAVVGGKAAEALRALSKLRSQGQPAQLIIPMLARQLRLVWKAKMLLEMRDGQERAPLKPDMQDWQVRKTAPLAKRFTWKRLREALEVCLEKDLALKGIEGPPVSEEEALETLIITLCGSR